MRAHTELRVSDKRPKPIIATQIQAFKSVGLRTLAQLVVIVVFNLLPMRADA